jgi:hypothetical protein
LPDQAIDCRFGALGGAAVSKQAQNLSAVSDGKAFVSLNCVDNSRNRRQPAQAR